MTAVDRKYWAASAKCKGTEDALFAEGVDQRRARLLCNGCPVRSECLAEALDNRIEWGVWGGMTERERRALLRQRPDVSSWSAVLCGPVDGSVEPCSFGRAVSA
jgi:WhiB family redox-sensing transcriptional regulator